MKNTKFLLATLFICFMLSTPMDANASSVLSIEPLKAIKFEKLFSNKMIDFGADLSEGKKVAYLAMASYNENTDYFSLKTFKEIKFIQVYDAEGELEYQLPINNSDVHFSLNDFEKGKYEIKILFEDETNYLTTHFVKKQ